MTVSYTATGQLSSALRMGLLVSTAFASVLLAGETARAACDPAAADDVTATCTGATSGDPAGYGSGAETNLNVRIVSGANVSGTTHGVWFNTGSVTNSGTITGLIGIHATTATVINSSNITGTGGPGVWALDTANVTNFGTITGDLDGIVAGSIAAIVNSGSITGTTSCGICAGDTANVVNLSGGTITGVLSGIAAITANVINFDSIAGTTFDGIFGDTANVINLGTGTISGAENGILANDIANMINFGSVIGTFGAGVSAATADVTNLAGGTIEGGQYGINASNTADVINSGTIIGGDRGIWAGATANVINFSGGTITGYYGIYADDTANVINSGTITGASQSIVADTGSANVINSGTITGYNNGIGADAVNVTNSGSIIGTTENGIYAGDSANAINLGTGIITGGNYGIYTGTTADVINSGSIRGGISGIWADDTADVTNLTGGTIEGTLDAGILAKTADVANSGTIAGGTYGISAADTANVINSGAISGGNVGIQARTTANVTTSGTIIGGSGIAMRFNTDGTAASDSLTILPGARFGGLVNFGGGADRVNFGPGNWILNIAQFNEGLSTVTTPGTPYMVTPNQIIVADLSGFGAMNRALMDITGWIASVLPDAPVFEPEHDSRADAFAAIEAAAPRHDYAFDSGTQAGAALAYAPAPAFKSGALTDRDGNRIWAKGFGGRRDQASDGGFIGSITLGYGGAIGYDRQITPATRLGGFIGGSTNETRLRLNAGGTDTDALFGGLYARSLFGPRGASFLDLALIGGRLDNASTRNLGGGMALETARASYDGWFVNPAATLGHRFALSHGYTLTPALKLRYVAAGFGGYTETGSSVNLVVGDRNFQAFEERAELTLANTSRFDNGSRLGVRLTGGLLAQQRSGDANVNIVLVGQNFIAATPDKQSVLGLYGGAGLDWRLGRMALFAAGEIAGMDDATTSFAAKGGLRVAW